MSNLIERAKNVLLTPKTEWPVIAAEPETTSGLYTKYILILSALGPIAMFFKVTMIGTQVPFLGTFRVDMGTGLTQLVLAYVLGLVAVYRLRAHRQRACADFRRAEGFDAVAQDRGLCARRPAGSRASASCCHGSAC